MSLSPKSQGGRQISSGMYSTNAATILGRFNIFFFSLSVRLITSASALLVSAALPLGNRPLVFPFLLTLSSYPCSSSLSLSLQLSVPPLFLLSKTLPRASHFISHRQTQRDTRRHQLIFSNQIAPTFLLSWIPLSWRTREKGLRSLSPAHWAFCSPHKEIATETSTQTASFLGPGQEKEM